jgi:RNA polymerase sigma-70 factor (ECF subfamily)
MTTSVHKVAETVARESFGRLVSWLAYQWRDIAAAEDAMSDALLKALIHWPEKGIPSSPEAWLLTVAKRQLLQKVRHEKLALASTYFAVPEEDVTDDDMLKLAAEIPDKRLALMLTCAHPEIEAAIRVPLMLQSVLGLQANEIASAMLVSPAALAQRLVRAKQIIRAQQLSYDEADINDLPNRIQFVLEAIYGAYGIGNDDLEGIENRISDLTQEAIFLCNLVCELLPASAEAKGLLALMLFNQARKPAHHSADDVFIPLSQKNPQLWDKKMIQQADSILLDAFSQRQPGYFQLEAAVQSAHCHRLFTGVTPWNAIADLYRQINQHFPTQGSLVAGAVAMAEAGNPQAAIDLLESMDKKFTQNFQPWWVARAHVFFLTQEPDAARAALDRAIGLSTQEKIINYLSELKNRLNTPE